MNSDATHLPELTRRQEEILALIVRAYTHKPEPISSKYLVEGFDLSLSSATIRNEMAVLEELGYIYAPHTSAGRVPTENGYRYFVQRLLHDQNGLAAVDKNQIAHRLQTLPLATEQWMRFAASVLARNAQTAALVTQPAAHTARYKHVELISIQGRLALMVLVLQGGTVHQRMLNLAEPVPQSTLSETANRINALCEGLTANEILMKSNQLNLLEQEVLELAAELVDNSGGNNQARVVYREGLSEMVSSIQTTDIAAQAIRVFEERTFLNIILDEFLSPLESEVQVIIAGEGRREEINQLSMVLSRYGVPGKLTGAIGVLGPTYINYGKAISTVRYVSSLMTNMMVELYKNGDDSDTSEQGDSREVSPPPPGK